MKVHELIHELLSKDQQAEVCLEAAHEPVEEYRPVGSAWIDVDASTGKGIVVLSRFDPTAGVRKDPQT